MPWWGTVVIAVAGVAGTLAAALLSPWTHHLMARADRRAQAQEARVREAAAVAGPITALLNDANPQSLGISVRPDDPFQRLRPVSERWQELRTPLSVFGASDPSPTIRELARALDAAVTKSLTMTGHFLGDLTSHASDRDSYEQAKSDYTEARSAVTAFMDAVRRDP